VYKIALLTLSFLALVGILLLPGSGCSSAATGSEDEITPSTQPAPPALDMELHSSVETAYFALG